MTMTLEYIDRQGNEIHDHGFELSRGSHRYFGAGHCLMEVVAHLAGEHHTDSPVCASRVFSFFAWQLNDCFLTTKARTRHLWMAAPLLVNTAAGKQKEIDRAYQLMDLAVRRWAPAELDKLGEAMGKGKFAREMRGLPPINSEDSAKTAHELMSRHSLWGPYGSLYQAYFCLEAEPRASSNYAAMCAYKSGCMEDAAACFIAILQDKDPWEVPFGGYFGDEGSDPS